VRHRIGKGNQGGEEDTMAACFRSKGISEIKKTQGCEALDLFEICAPFSFPREIVLRHRDLLIIQSVISKA
jgi:hypothetical protein